MASEFAGLCSHRLWMISLVAVAVLLPFVPPGVDAKQLQGNNVCTRVRSVTEITRVPLFGTKTQTIRYTTICGLQGRCSRYRMVYVRNYQEVSRTVYRVMQECCAGWIQERTRCVVRSLALPATTTTTTSVPGVTVASGTPQNGQQFHPVSWPGVTTWHGDLPGARGATDGQTGGGAAGGTRRVNTDGTSAGGRKGGGMRGDNGGGKGNRPGTDGTSKTRNADDTIKGGTNDNNEYGGATPDKQQPQKDSGMMFLTGMLCGVAVLSVAAFFVIFLMYRQRRHTESRIIGIPLFQSTSSGSSSIRKSKLLAFAQSINSGQMKIIREPTKKGKGRAHCPYTDIEELLQKGITFNNSTESLPALSAKSAKDKTMSLKMPKLTLKQSTSWKHLKNDRKLPPKPPTYAIIQRPDWKRKSTGDDVERPPSIVQRAESTLYATPDGVPNGTSNTIPRDFNMGPPRYILCESQHIYTDIQRKSKAMSWSCSKRLRSKSSGSAYDSPKRERVRQALSRSLSRSSLQNSTKRDSNSGSSGYSSLRGSRENIYDNCAENGTESASRPCSNIYSETIPKDRTSAHYGKLDLGLSDTFKTEYDKLNRGPTTRGLVKSFSKKYEKLAMSKTGTGPYTEAI